MKRIQKLRWLGKLLAPAEDPRANAADSVGVPDTQALLAELRRSRGELAQLRAQIENRDPQSQVAGELAEEERELIEAEQHLLRSVDEQRARAALLTARLHAADAQIRAES
jgi:uncharacterized protein YydD (DUF2326 family)